MIFDLIYDLLVYLKGDSAIS